MSAIKVDGQRAYARVRAGEDVELADRPVTVSAFTVHDVRPAPTGRTGGPRPDVGRCLDVDVTVVCSSGTYVRALARDLGAAPRRRRSPHRPAPHPGRRVHARRGADARRARGPPDDVPLDVLSLADAARATFPVRDLTEAEARSLSFGHRIPLPSGTPADPAPDASGAPADPTPDASGTPGAPGRPVAGIGPDGTLVALLQAAGPQARPVVVFAPA